MPKGVQIGSLEVMKSHHVYPNILYLRNSESGALTIASGNAPQIFLKCRDFVDVANSKHVQDFAKLLVLDCELKRQFEFKSATVSRKSDDNIVEVVLRLSSLDTMIQLLEKLCFYYQRTRKGSIHTH